MAGVLRLNDLSVADNPAYGSHDPGMMWDPRSRRYYSYSTDCFLPKAGLKEKIGIPVRVSDDLVHFSYQGTVLSPAAIRQGRDNGAYPATKGFWAPYGEYVHGEYRLYYSATRDFGSSESRIWLAVSQDPLGPFENRGVVADTWGTDDSLPNAIDPHVLHAGEEDYLVYGSFFGGIYMKRLCPETGLAQNPDPHFLGKCVAHQMPPRPWRVQRVRRPCTVRRQGTTICSSPTAGWGTGTTSGWAGQRIPWDPTWTGMAGIWRVRHRG